MISRAEQRRIVQSDRERRILRDVETELALQGRVSTGTGSVTGVPENRHRVIRASDSSWNALMKPRKGIAPGTEDSSDGTPTVLCTYADGTSEIRPVSSFRKDRKSRPRIKSEPTVQTRVEPLRMDDARFGVNDYLASE